MKKFLIASGVAVLAFASVAGAQGTMFNTNLTVGSTGSDVVALQTWLIANGYSIPSIASGAAAKGYFGSQTKAAVQAYQAAKGIPSTGFVGPLTRGALNAGGAVVTTPSVSCPVGMICTPVGGGTPVVSTGGLAGTDGVIDEVTLLSSYSNEEVGDGQNDIKVAGFEVAASNDGDIALKSIKVTFDSTGNGGSDNLDDYIETVSVWQGSTKIGSADASSFNDVNSTDWSKTITLNNSVVRADKTEKFYITVSSVGNLDSGDISSDSWTVDIDSIRYEDGSGVVSTETVTTDEVGIAFVSFSASADTELKISTDTNATPAEGSVKASSDSDTDDVLLLVGKIRLDGTSDVTIDELPITFTSVGTNVVSVTDSVRLVLGSEDFSETVSTSTASLTGAGTSGTITFDNLDFDVSAGSSVTFKVYADINDLDGSTFNAGDSISASLTSTNRDYIDVENEEGDQLADASEKSGTATGETQSFYEEGIAVSLVSVEDKSYSVDSSDNDRVELIIKFKVEAFGEDAYIPKFMTPTTNGTNATTGTGSSSTTPSTSSGIAFHVQSADTDLTIARLSGTTLSSTADEQTNSYLVQEGTPETFTLKVVVANAATSLLDSASIRAILTGVNFGDTDSATGDYVFTSGLSDTFKTDYAIIAD